jgi:hypothetical protein
MMARQPRDLPQRRRFTVGAYQIVAQPIAGSAQMLRYTVFLEGRRVGAMASMPTESDCRFLAEPPAVPPVKPFHLFYRPGRPKKGTQAASALASAERNSGGATLDELSGAVSLPARGTAAD